MSDTIVVSVIGVVGSVIVALIAAFAPYIRAAFKSIIEGSKQPIPSGQVVRDQARKFSLPIVALGFAVTALLISWHKTTFPLISFDEHEQTDPKETKLIIDVPEGQLARVILVGTAKADSDYLNNRAKIDEFRFGLTLTISDENEHIVAEDTDWIPMFVNRHNPALQPPQLPVEGPGSSLKDPTSFVACGVGTIPLRCSAVATLVLKSGKHTLHATSQASNTQVPLVTLSYVVVFTKPSDHPE